MEISMDNRDNIDESNVNKSLVLVDPNNSSDDYNCMICLELVDTYIITNNCTCKLCIHEDCFKQWLTLNKNCLICKTKLKNISYTNLKLEYFNREFSNSKLSLYLEFLMNVENIITRQISNEIIKYLLFNLLFVFFTFINITMIILYIWFVSQIKYLLDSDKLKTTQQKPYKIFFF
jgi:hypothetical protein